MDLGEKQEISSPWRAPDATPSSASPFQCRSSSLKDIGERSSGNRNSVDDATPSRDGFPFVLSLFCLLADALCCILPRVSSYAGIRSELIFQCYV